MSLMGWIILGLVAGTVAKSVSPAAKGSGIIGTILLGIIGAYVGGTLVRLLNTGKFAPAPSQLTVPGILVAALGAIVTVFVWSVLVGKLKK